MRLQLPALDKRLAAVWEVAQVGSLTWKDDEDVVEMQLLLHNVTHILLCIQMSTLKPGNSDGGGSVTVC